MSRNQSRTLARDLHTTSKELSKVAVQVLNTFSHF